MSISTRVASFLDVEGIHYDTIAHPRTVTSENSASAAHIPPESLAKAVVLEDHENHYLLAILPADHKIDLEKLSTELGKDLHLAEEKQVYRIFLDCEHGAVPPTGEAYYLSSVCDEALDQQKDVYLEAGDHETLIHLTQAEFKKLMADARHLRFSAEALH